MLRQDQRTVSKHNYQLPGTTVLNAHVANRRPSHHHYAAILSNRIKDALLSSNGFLEDSPQSEMGTANKQAQQN